MAWLDKIESPLVIITGDGERFEPFNVFAEKEAEYNVAVFEFPNVRGTLVKRTQPKGRKYKLEIYFQGEDNIEESTAFLTSAEDPRAWNLIHPYEGSIDVQPIKLNIDNREYNVTKITGTVIESIPEVFPQAAEVPEDKIQADKVATDEAAAESYAVNNPEPSNADKGDMNTTLDQLEATTEPAITNDAEQSAFRNSLQKARSAVTVATTQPLAAMRAIQEVVNAPLLLQQTVETRLGLVLEQFNILTGILTNGGDPSPKSSAVYFESALGTTVSLLGGIAGKGGEALGFTSRSQVDNAITNILGSYGSYVDSTEVNQTPTGAEPSSYIPDPETQILLSDLVSYTVSKLFDIAVDVRQERSLFLEEESDPISLAHRFYGLTLEDETIDQFIATNDIGISEMLLIRKGREIVYFV